MVGGAGLRPELCTRHGRELVHREPARYLKAVGRSRLDTMHNRWASVGSVVNGQMVTESVSKQSSWTFTAGRGLPA